jgi:hypothetical protein
MYVVEILNAEGDPAEFAVANPVVALDLVLRAQRAALRWQVYDEACARSLPLEDVRDRALAFAAVDADATEQLEQVDREHERGCRAALN